MTEDDWRWHMYDTVRLVVFGWPFARLSPSRSRVPTGLVTKTLSTTCVARLLTLLSRYVITVPYTRIFSEESRSSNISECHSREQRRARFINVLSVDSLSSLVKVARHTDVLLPLTERVMLFSTLFTGNHCVITPSSSLSTSPWISLCRTASVWVY